MIDVAFIGSCDPRILVYLQFTLFLFCRFLNLNRELNRLQTAYQQSQSHGGPHSEQIKFLFETGESYIIETVL